MSKMDDERFNFDNYFLRKLMESVKAQMFLALEQSYVGKNILPEITAIFTNAGFSSYSNRPDKELRIVNEIFHSSKEGNSSTKVAKVICFWDNYTGDWDIRVELFFSTEEVKEDSRHRRYFEGYAEIRENILDLIGEERIVFKSAEDELVIIDEITRSGGAVDSNKK